MLLGGLDLWQDEILFPALVVNPTPAQEIDFARRAAIAKFFGGTPRTDVTEGEDRPQLLAPPPPMVAPLAPINRKKRKEGC